MKRVAILQSNYIPWRGYFDLIAYVDEFILYDVVQYTKRDWRNRNQIKTPSGRQWITVPVKGDVSKRIYDIHTASPDWRWIHWRTLESNYRRAACFSEASSFLKPLYLESDADRLSDINETFIREICRFLGVSTMISPSHNYEIVDGKCERLIRLCQQAGATKFVSGPAAKSYIDEQVFADHQIEVEWFHYDGFPEYPQLWGPFEAQVSIVDLLMNCGKESPRYLRYA